MKTWMNILQNSKQNKSNEIIVNFVILSILTKVIISVADADPDPPGSTTFVRNHLDHRAGYGLTINFQREIR